ncbi:MAG: NAD(+)/NADH kinase [Bacillota bacterium]|nr:NAD(+)/NADH kinase [Bacillota bacterium]
MRNIGLYINRDKDTQLKHTAEVVEAIIKNGGNIMMPEDVAQLINLKEAGKSETEIFSKTDMIICLGGDGTFLKAARKAFKNDIPVLGVNLGNLGFLAEIDKSDIKNAIDKLFRNEYSIEERMMLEADFNTANGFVKEYALNDIVISRSAVSGILHIKTYLNNLFVDSFPGDGMIISTPTGSTAYSLSAGGPMVEPEVDLIILNPICPHILYSRPIIATGDRVVKALVDKKYCQDAVITVDGQKGYEIKAGDIVEIRRSSYRAKIVRLYERNFFNVLRNKIYQRGECLREDEV